MTRTSTDLPSALPRAVARRARWVSSRGMAERTSATSRLRSVAALATSRSTMAGSSRPRPALTTKEASATVVGWARAPSTSSTTPRRRSTGMASSVRVVRSSSEPSSTRAKRNSSSSTSPRAPSALATSNSASA